MEYKMFRSSEFIQISFCLNYIFHFRKSFFEIMQIEKN